MMSGSSLHPGVCRRAYIQVFVGGLVCYLRDVSLFGLSVPPGVCRRAVHPGVCRRAVHPGVCRRAHVLFT